MKTAITTLFVLCAACLSKAQNIRQAEYFIDKDKGIGKNTKIILPASVDSNYAFNIDLSGVSTGMHKLYIRTKDNNEKWSLTARKDIEIMASLDQQKIIAGEYFFDIDPGYGNANKIAVAADDINITQSFVAASNDLKDGYHKLYTRFKDSLSKWSITLRKNIEIIRTADTNKVIAAEYFFSSDKGFGRAAAKTFVEPAEDGKFKFKIAYNNIPAGADTLFVRVQDSLGNWSLTKLSAFTVSTLLTAATTEIQVNNNFRQFTAFPNPATTFINVNYPLQNKSAMLKVFDVNGKAVLQQVINSENFKVDVSSLIAGTYMLQIKDGDAIETLKIIKQ